MRATTLRFSDELWSMLDDEAAAAGVSVAQYIREAALARVMFSAGRRGDPAFAAAIDGAGRALDRRADAQGPRSLASVDGRAAEESQPPPPPDQS